MTFKQILGRTLVQPHYRENLMRSIKFTGGLTRGRGFEENVRNLWVMIISYSAAVHESMIKLSGVSIGSRDQNIDMRMKIRN